MNGNLHVKIYKSVTDIGEAAWNACAPTGNPFTRFEFFSAIELSESASPRAGWSPHHFAALNEQNKIIGILPAYLKTNSAGEYVFDHHWGDAFERAGGRYYPKVQISVPFTPVPGPRLLTHEPETVGPIVLTAVAAFCDTNHLSSAHATFIAPGQRDIFEQSNWLIRTDQQFHWHNRDYKTYDDFLNALASRKRKTIRKERDTARQSDIEIEHITGAALQEIHWDAMWNFYIDTGNRKWGRPYLTRDFFTRIHETMADKILLVMAKRQGRYIAGALNFIGTDALYGRNWGCNEDHPFLHFEICYHQAIEFAIARGLKTVEAGAQGAHKLARGYEPVTTYSAHYIAHPGFRSAIEDFLAQERSHVDAEIEYLGQRTPFRKGALQHELD
jgi:uncharacterized protein